MPKTPLPLPSLPPPRPPGVIQGLLRPPGILVYEVEASVPQHAAPPGMRWVARVGVGETRFQRGASWMPNDIANGGGVPSTPGLWFFVDTSQAGFTSLPTYTMSLTSLYFKDWTGPGLSAVAGPACIARPGSKGFSVFLKYTWDVAGCAPAAQKGAIGLTPRNANKFKWFISWQGVELVARKAG